MHVVVIEDEQLAYRNLKSILNEIGGIEILAQIESIVEAVEWFDTHNQPELVFMDIHLADGLAFEIFDRTTIKCPVVFTTAYDEYALRAFNVNSVDYLLKPLNALAVRKSLEKYKNFSRSDLPVEIRDLLASFKKQTNYKSNFLVPGKGDKLIPLSVENIAYVYIENGITQIHTFDEKNFSIDEHLDDMMQKLNPGQFFRANRQFIISRNAVKDIDLWFNNRLAVNLKMPTPEKIIISKARNSEFKDWFTDF